MRTILILFISMSICLSIIGCENKEITSKKVSRAITENITKENSLKYFFKNKERGFAEGTLKLDIKGLKEKKNYDLYWGDGSGALKKYSKICQLKLSPNDSAKSYDFISTNLIPNEATRVVAINNNKIKYDFKIPKYKRIIEERLFRFGLLSDVHIDANDNDKAESVADFKRAILHFKKQKADFIGISGDTTTDGRLIDMKKYRNVIDDNAGSLPIYVSRGNHDCKNDANNLNLYKEYIESNGQYFEKRINNEIFLFMGLDSYDYQLNSFTEEQMTWFENKMEKYKDQRVFVFEHVFIGPTGNAGDLYPYGNGGFIFEGDNISNRFKKCIDTYKNVVFISGHSHLAFDLQRISDDANCAESTDERCNRVHVPGGSRPRVNSIDTPDNKSNTVNNLKGSQGYLVNVYKDYITLEGIDFQKGKYLPLAQYIIKTK